MTFREKLADWISGGALNDAQNIADCWKDLYNEVRIDYIQCRNQSDKGWAAAGQWRKAIEYIRDETGGIQSGTAQKIHRMAKEALGE